MLDRLRKRPEGRLGAGCGVSLSVGVVVGLEESSGKVGGWMISCMLVSVRRKVNSGKGADCGSCSSWLWCLSRFLRRSFNGIVAGSVS